MSFDFNPHNRTLSEVDLIVLEYLNQNSGLVPSLSITDMSKQLQISPSTLSRVFRRLGFNNLKHLKQALLENQRISPAVKLSARTRPDSNTPEVFHETIALLEKTLQHFDPLIFEQAIEQLNSAKRIFIYGKDAAYAPAYLMYFRFNRFNKHVHLFNASGSSLFETLNVVNVDDLIVLFAFGSMPIEAKILIEHSKKAGLSTLLITDRLTVNPNFPVTIQLFVARGDSTQYHGMSTVMSMLDALVMAYAQRYPDTTGNSLESLYALKESYASKLPR